MGWAALWCLSSWSRGASCSLVTCGLAGGRDHHSCLNIAIVIFIWCLCHGLYNIKLYLVSRRFNSELQDELGRSRTEMQVYHDDADDDGDDDECVYEEEAIGQFVF